MLARRHRTDFVSEARLIWMNGRPNLASGNDPGTSTLGLSRRKAARSWSYGACFLTGGYRRQDASHVNIAVLRRETRPHLAPRRSSSGRQAGGASTATFDATAG